MDEKKAKEILTKELGPEFYILESGDKVRDIFTFYICRTEEKDNPGIPLFIGVDSSGKVLEASEIIHGSTS